MVKRDGLITDVGDHPRSSPHKRLPNIVVGFLGLAARPRVGRSPRYRVRQIVFAFMMCGPKMVPVGILVSDLENVQYRRRTVGELAMIDSELTEDLPMLANVVHRE